MLKKSSQVYNYDNQYVKNLIYKFLLWIIENKPTERELLYLFKLLEDDKIELNSLFLIDF